MERNDRITLSKIFYFPVALVYFLLVILFWPTWACITGWRDSLGDPFPAIISAVILTVITGPLVITSDSPLVGNKIVCLYLGVVLGGILVVLIRHGLKAYNDFYYYMKGE